MVVATPCPLILAAPIAFVAGLSRAARAGIIVKGGGALERLGTAKTVLLDKTGTLTLGQPELERIVTLRTPRCRRGSPTRGLCRPDVDPRPRGEPRRCCSDRESSSSRSRPGSPRTRAAGSSARSTARPSSSARAAGSRATGTRVFAARHREHDAGDGAGRAKILVGIDGHLAAVIVMGDRLRPGADTLARELQEVGVGPRGPPDGRPGRDRTRGGAERRHRPRLRGTDARGKARCRSVDPRPAGDAQRRHGRRRHQRRSRARARRRGDRHGRQGSNDLVGDRGRRDHGRQREQDRAVDRRSAVARSTSHGRASVYGLGLSVAAMFVAAFGYLPPVWGALFQEVIDVAVILNALRALRG